MDNATERLERQLELSRDFGTRQKLLRKLHQIRRQSSAGDA